MVKYWTRERHRYIVILIPFPALRTKETNARSVDHPESTPGKQFEAAAGSSLQDYTDKHWFSQGELLRFTLRRSYLGISVTRCFSANFSSTNRVNRLGEFWSCKVYNSITWIAPSSNAKRGISIFIFYVFFLIGFWNLESVSKLVTFT